jgi:hypothetical protein
VSIGQRQAGLQAKPTAALTHNDNPPARPDLWLGILKGDACVVKRSKNPGAVNKSI